MSHYICGKCGTDTISSGETILRAQDCTNDHCPLRHGDAWVVKDAEEFLAEWAAGMHDDINSGQ